MIGWIILAAVVVIAAVVLIRTLLFKPNDPAPLQQDEILLDHEKLLTDMADMIRCRTISSKEDSYVDWGEFDKFQALLAERFPAIHAASSLKKLGRTGLLYHLPGKSSQNPSVCMAHYDVVPVEEEGWDKPPFEAIIEDGEMWGRGTLDTKGTLCGMMEALEALLKQGFVPQNDLYLSFSGDEEISGGSCPAIVDYLEEQGIVPALVVDEGGAVVDHVFPGVKKSIAVVGIAEKGCIDMKFALRSQGGHASTPPRHSLLGHLSKAVTRIEAKPFRRQLTKPVSLMFDTLGRHSSFVFRMIFANLWLFLPVVDIWAKSTGGDINALLRTTVAVTRMKGSKSYNVLPPKANFGINVRLLGKDTVDSTVKYLKKIIQNDKIEVTVVSGSDPSVCSVAEGEGWDKLSRAIRQTWDDTIVVPYLMMAASDSRHYGRISDKVYRFSAMYMTKEQRGLIHGNNERIPIETLVRCAEFYTRLLRQL